MTAKLVMFEEIVVILDVVSITNLYVLFVANVPHFAHGLSIVIPFYFACNVFCVWLRTPNQKQGHTDAIYTVIFIKFTQFDIALFNNFASVDSSWH